RIVKELSESVMSWNEAVSKYGFPENTLRMWKRNYNEYGVCSRKRGRPRKGGSDGDEERQTVGKREQIAARRDYYLQDVLPRLRGKRDGSSKKKTLRAVGECRRLGIPLRRCLEVLGLSSSTYHFWKSHENEESQKDKKLSEAIRCAQEQNHWAYGSKRMAKWLVSAGFADRLNHKRVERVMGKFDLHARIRRRRYPKNYYLALKENPVELPGNVLARDFIADKPMQKLVTDITYLPTNEGWVYMAAVMDLWNREIVSYRISRHISLELVKDVVSQLGPCRGTLIHSDKGWTYTHPIYIKHLKQLGFRQSMSRKGNCWDNACMENFFGLMKSETIKQSKELLSVDGMIKLIDDYIHWYNNQRIQKKLGYLSPVDFRKLAT
ncbi:MAG: IS3 family transposase, partial [Candidatus Methanomethylophilaceae archaeon]|nr:IS3 family transposase [Candidatus Methanomethylophilaceae archaeon]